MTKDVLPWNGGLSRPAPAWSVLVIGVVIAVLTSWGIEALNDIAESDARQVALFARLDGLVNQLRPLEGIAKEPLGTQSDAGVREWAEELDALLDEARVELGMTLAELERLDADGARQVGVAIEHYIADTEELARLVASGEDEAAESWDEARVDPSFAVARDLIEREDAAHRQAAARAARLADWETVASLAVGVPAAGLLIRRFEQKRRAAAVLTGEQRALRRSEARFRALAQHGADLITVLTPEGTVSYQSPSSAAVLGHQPEALLGKSFTEIAHPDAVAAVRRLTAEAIRRTGGAVAAELRFRHADGSWRTLDTIANLLPADAGMDGVLLTSRDVTERKALEEQLRRQAFHDSLTNLPNRALFLDRLEHALVRSALTAEPVTVLFIDLDEFKVVNDSLGHQRGDELLTAVAKRLCGCVRRGDTVARLGGDEFTVLLEAAGLGTATEMAERIGARLRAPIDLDGHPVVVGVSIGIAAKGSPEDRADDLLRNADVAMYVAKQNGKGRYAVYDASLRAKAWDRLELEADLRRAIAAGELRVDYQPIVDLATGRVVEVEALVRWAHSQRGVMAPAEFIPLAEETGLIVPIGWWVLEEACRQVPAWERACLQEPPLAVGVNLSPYQFQHPALVEEVARVLAETGLDPSRLTLEITEGVMMQDGDAAAETLRRLKALGVRLAMDDFGTGYSSLAYLQSFPIDVLKIDGSFVSRLGQGTESQAIVRTIVGLAKTLGLVVVGEGVETAEQLAHLRAVGCERGQGYFLARPLPATEVCGLLTAGVGRPHGANQ